MNDDDKPQGTDIEIAAKAFEAMLAADEAKPLDDEPEEVEAEADEAEEADTEDETSEPDEGEDAEEEAEADAEDEADGEPDLDQLVTVVVDGKTEKIPLKEALDGYQRQADYSRKTAQLAEERRSFMSEVQQVQQERQVYSQLLGQLEHRLKAEIAQEPNWDELKRSDPVGWAIARAEWDERMQNVYAVQAEQARVMQQQLQLQQQAYREHISAERQKLHEARPEWKDDKTWQRDRARLLDYGKKLGFTDEDLAQTADHRAVLALWKAMQFDEAANRKERPVQKQQAPKTLAPKAPVQNNPAKKRDVSDLTRAKQRLAKTGRWQDAASVFEKLI